MLGAADAVGGLVFTRQHSSACSHDPVSVVIADFENSTGDPAFDRTLEPMLSARSKAPVHQRVRPRRASDARSACNRPTELDEEAARELAVKQGLGVVAVGFDRSQRQWLRDFGRRRRRR